MRLPTRCAIRKSALARAPPRRLLMFFPCAACSTSSSLQRSSSFLVRTYGQRALQPVPRLELVMWTSLLLLNCSSTMWSPSAPSKTCSASPSPGTNCPPLVTTAQQCLQVSLSRPSSIAPTPAEVSLVRRRYMCAPTASGRKSASDPRKRAKS